eukprot:CAMPEP_0114144242 /NCGR_PEP_ID=MMETSP0043_2-20121206/19409_1 /TAXON_ID=464988 /ORGANISM="Hemiselmis andersenii, Strain CCMP644" /LENGTH=280 /DNA_ID=CAMNT_0001238581 /DNA_START=114 /DNA_END=952 /DNA_ORIENTATION=-
MDARSFLYTVAEAGSAGLSSAWLGTKSLERSVRGASSWLTESVNQTRDEKDQETQRNLAQFERLKKHTTELNRLARQYAKQQQQVMETEHELALLLKEMGIHETASPHGGRSMGECMTDAGDMINKVNREREPVVATCDGLADHLENLMHNAVTDVDFSVTSYDAARRDYHAAEVVLGSSASAQKDMDKQRILKVQRDEAANVYRKLQWQLNQKLALLSHHRSRDLCMRLNTVMSTYQKHHSTCNNTFSTWTTYKPREGDALGVIEHCYENTAPAEIISP